MDSTFVPLLTPSASGDPPANAAMRLKVLPRAEPAGTFQPLTVLPAPAAPAEDGAASPVSHEPSIELERSGDRITSIRVRCACGQTTVIECGY